VEHFPVYVTAFITDSVAEQRSQFILVNSTKPLPKGLIHELLPSTPAADLPALLLKRRYPAQLLDRLNYDPDSPLFRRIRTPTTAEGTIKDNSILKMGVKLAPLPHARTPARVQPKACPARTESPHAPS
jgi:DGQHR domain-containing protein